MKVYLFYERKSDDSLSFIAYTNNADYYIRYKEYRTNDNVYDLTKNISNEEYDNMIKSERGKCINEFTLVGKNSDTMDGIECDVVCTDYEYELISSMFEFETFLDMDLASTTSSHYEILSDKYFTALAILRYGAAHLFYHHPDMIDDHPFSFSDIYIDELGIFIAGKIYGVIE